MAEDLGPFQGMWEAWAEASEEINRKPLSHFRRAAEIQFDELEEHLSVGDREAAAREVADIISIAINTMRWLGYTPEEIAEVAQNRAEHRMKGKAPAILAKYMDRYGI